MDKTQNRHRRRLAPQGQLVNRKVAQAMCALAGDRLDCTIVEIGDLPLFNQDIDGDAAARLDRVQGGRSRPPTACCSSRPEYNRSIPGALKNAIDVGSRPYGKSVWEKKPAAIVTASPGRDRRLRLPTISCASPACSSTCR